MPAKLWTSCRLSNAFCTRKAPEISKPDWTLLSLVAIPNMVVFFHSMNTVLSGSECRRDDICCFCGSHVCFRWISNENQFAYISIYYFLSSSSVLHPHSPGARNWIPKYHPPTFITSLCRWLPLYIGIKGYEWVGWRNDTYGTDGRPVEMIFEFDSVRNFSAIVLHTNNMFSKDVQVSQLALFWISALRLLFRVHASTDGMSWSWVMGLSNFAFELGRWSHILRRQKHRICLRNTQGEVKCVCICSIAGSHSTER